MDFLTRDYIRSMNLLVGDYIMKQWLKKKRIVFRKVWTSIIQWKVFFIILILNLFEDDTYLETIWSLLMYSFFALKKCKINWINLKEDKIYNISFSDV